MSTLRENTTRAKQAKLTLYIHAAFCGIVFISGLFQHFLLLDIKNGELITMQEASMNDLRHMILIIFRFISLIVAAVFYIMWFRRSYYNQEQTIGKMESTNGWCSGAWFIPIYSLYKPYALMQELYHNANRYLKNIHISVPEKRNSMMLGIWWAGWVVLNITQNIVNRLGGRTTDINSLITFNFIDMILLVAFALLIIPTVKVISNYNEMELKINENHLNSSKNSFNINLDTDLLDS